MPKYNHNVNNKKYTVDAEVGTPHIRVLREGRLDLMGINIIIFNLNRLS
jgi:hypothetical protein